MSQDEEILRFAFQRLIYLEEGTAVMQDFIDHSKCLHAGDDKLIAVLDELQQQIPKEV